MRSCAGALGRAALLVAGMTLVGGGAGGCRHRGKAARARRDGGAGRGAGATNSGAPASTGAHETAVLTGVAVQREHPEALPGLDDRELGRSVGEALVASDAFVARAADVPAGRHAAPARVDVSIQHQLIDGGKDKGRAIVVAVTASIDWQVHGDRLTPRENVVVERPVEDGKGKGGEGGRSATDAARLGQMTVEVVQSAVARAADGLARREALRQAPDAKVVAALTDASPPDPDRQIWALDIVAYRRLAAGFSRAVALLDAKDPGVRAAALRALVALRDPRAVPALSKRMDFADKNELLTIIEAAGAIGGSDAADLLDVLASGHPDPEVRARAKQGLERLRRRKATSGAAAHAAPTSPPGSAGDPPGTP